MALLLRRMGHLDGTAAIAFWFIALVGVGAGVLSVLNWVPIKWEHWPWMVLLGASTWWGAAVIVSSGLYIIFREQRVKRRRQTVLADGALPGQVVKNQKPEDTAA